MCLETHPPLGYDLLPLLNKSSTPFSIMTDSIS